MQLAIAVLFLKNFFVSKVEFLLQFSWEIRTCIKFSLERNFPSTGFLSQGCSLYFHMFMGSWWSIRCSIFYHLVSSLKRGKSNRLISVFQPYPGPFKFPPPRLTRTPSTPLRLVSVTHTWFSSAPPWKKAWVIEANGRNPRRVCEVLNHVYRHPIIFPIWRNLQR